MPVTPQITLSINLMDYSGNQLGSATQPAWVRIALSNYGQFLPAIPGTAFAAKVASWPQDIPYTGAQITVKLFGNDVITPAGTFYTISLLDANKNVIQSVPYQFVGSGTVDLTSATPFGFTPIVPVVPTVSGALVTVPFSATPVFNAALVAAGIITFDITLSGNVTASTLTNPSPGQIVIFIIQQDLTGNRTFTWPSNVHNATAPEANASGITVQAFDTRTNGNLYPIGPATYN